MTQRCKLVSPDPFARLKRGATSPPFRLASCPGDRHPCAQPNLIQATITPLLFVRRRCRPSGPDEISILLPLPAHPAFRGQRLLPKHSPNPHNLGSCESRSSLPQPLKIQPQHRFGSFRSFGARHLNSPRLSVPFNAIHPILEPSRKARKSAIIHNYPLLKSGPLPPLPATLVAGSCRFFHSETTKT